MIWSTIIDFWCLSLHLMFGLLSWKLDLQKSDLRLRCPCVRHASEISFHIKLQGVCLFCFVLPLPPPLVVELWVYLCCINTMNWCQCCLVAVQIWKVRSFCICIIYGTAYKHLQYFSHSVCYWSIFVLGCGFHVQIFLLAWFRYTLHLLLRPQRNQYLPVRYIMIKGLSHGFGRQVLMHGFLPAWVRPLMVLMVHHMIRVIYIVLFVMKVVHLKYLMCLVLIVFFLRISLCLERPTLLIRLCKSQPKMLKGQTKVLKMWLAKAGKKVYITWRLLSWPCIDGKDSIAALSFLGYWLMEQFFATMLTYMKVWRVHLKMKIQFLYRILVV